MDQENARETKTLIRKYCSSDCKETAALFYHTVHTVNAKDYTKAQRSVWAPVCRDLESWDRSLLAHTAFVAVKGNLIVGFGDIDETGYLDRLYVHRNYQRQGIATALCLRLEQTGLYDKVITDASITAKAFFEKRGYCTIRAQQVERGGIYLTNYRMEKKLVQ